MGLSTHFHFGGHSEMTIITLAVEDDNCADGYTDAMVTSWQDFNQDPNLGC